MAGRLVRDFAKFLPRTDSLLRTDVVSYVQTRGFPSQIHQKIVAANRKRNIARRMRKQNVPEISFVEKMKRRLKKTVLGSKRYDVSALETKLPPDDVYLIANFKRAVFTLEDAVRMHRQILHPSMLGQPDALLMASLQFNMNTKKKTKFLDSFSGNILYPNNFTVPGRIMRILCFCDTEAEEKAALDSGADVAGGEKLVKRCVDNDVDPLNFDYILATSSMLLKLQPLKNILKHRAPRGQAVGVDAGLLVKRFRNGIAYAGKGDPFEPDFGSLKLPFAKLDMDLEMIEENMGTLFREINTHAPKGRPPNSFISEVFIEAPPSTESFVIDRKPFDVIDQSRRSRKPAAVDETADDSDSDDDEAEEAAK